MGPAGGTASRWAATVSDGCGLQGCRAGWVGGEARRRWKGALGLTGALNAGVAGSASARRAAPCDPPSLPSLPGCQPQGPCPPSPATPSTGPAPAPPASATTHPRRDPTADPRPRRLRPSCRGPSPCGAGGACSTQVAGEASGGGQVGSRWANRRSLSNRLWAAPSHALPMHSGTLRTQQKTATSPCMMSAVSDARLRGGSRASGPHRQQAGNDADPSSRRALPSA